MQNETDNEQPAVCSDPFSPTGADERMASWYHTHHTKRSFASQYECSLLYWGDLLHLEHCGEELLGRRLREFAPYEALSAASRPALSISELGRKAGLVALTRPPAGSIVESMMAVAVAAERELWNFYEDVNSPHIPPFDPLMPDLRARYAPYLLAPDLTSPDYLLGIAASHLARLRTLPETRLAVREGCKDIAIDATVVACAVPSRTREQAEAKLRAVAAILPQIGAARTFALAMLEVAIKLENVRWGFLSGTFVRESKGIH